MYLEHKCLKYKGVAASTSDILRLPVQTVLVLWPENQAVIELTVQPRLASNSWSCLSCHVPWMPYHTKECHPSDATVSSEAWKGLPPSSLTKEEPAPQVSSWKAAFCGTQESKALNVCHKNMPQDDLSYMLPKNQIFSVFFYYLFEFILSFSKLFQHLREYNVKAE